jgi:addiction module HigA family antidote
MLLKEFLEPMEISQAELARSLGIPFQRVNEIVRGKRGVTAETAVLLGRFFDMSPNFWINAQSGTDLYRAQKHLAAVLPKIPKAIHLHPERIPV